MEMVDLALAPVLIGLTEVGKQLGIPSKYASVVSLVLGIGLGFLCMEGDIATKIIRGCCTGLAASGLYSGTKNIVE